MSREIQAMRDWLADCVWQDADTIAELPNAAILRAVERHYDGGLAGFRASL